MTLPVKNQAYDFYVAMSDKLDPDTFKINPTIAAGDFKVSTDGSAFTNLITLPAVDPSGSRTVRISLSAAEMNGEKVNIQGIDAAGDEWQDILASIDVPEGSIETILDIMEGDRIESATSLVINKKDTTTALIDKTITGSLYAGTEIKTTES